MHTTGGKTSIVHPNTEKRSRYTLFIGFIPRHLSDHRDVKCKHKCSQFLSNAVKRKWLRLITMFRSSTVTRDWVCVEQQSRCNPGQSIIGEMAELMGKSCAHVHHDVQLSCHASWALGAIASLSGRADGFSSSLVCARCIKPCKHKPRITCSIAASIYQATAWPLLF